MAGANYMGGKRNAAKARSKDATARTQKNFFGRQRLELLSRGLVGHLGRTAAPHGVRVSGGRVSDIGLAHARRSESSTDQAQPGSIPSRPAALPCTPKANPIVSKSVPHTCSSLGSRSNGSQSSKVLDALDMSDPLLLRATMDRLLALPDLAGLPQYPPKSRAAIFNYKPLLSKRLQSPGSKRYPGLRKRQRTGGSDVVVVSDRLVDNSSTTLYATSEADAHLRTSDSPSSTSCADFTHRVLHPVTSLESPHAKIQMAVDIQPREDFESRDLDDGSSYDGSEYSESDASLRGYHSPPNSMPHLLLQPSIRAPDLDTDLPNSSSSLQSGPNTPHRSSLSSLGLGQPETPEPCSTISGRQHIRQNSAFVSFGRRIKSPSLTQALSHYENRPNPPVTLLTAHTADLRTPYGFQSPGSVTTHNGSLSTRSFLVGESESLARISPQSPSTRMPKNLFDYEDPWSEIGMILGLQPPPCNNRGISSTRYEPLEDMMTNGRSGVGYIKPDESKNMSSDEVSRALSISGEPPTATSASADEHPYMDVQDLPYSDDISHSAESDFDMFDDHLIFLPIHDGSPQVATEPRATRPSLTGDEGCYPYIPDKPLHNREVMNARSENYPCKQTTSLTDATCHNQPPLSIRHESTEGSRPSDGDSGALGDQLTPSASLSLHESKANWQVDPLATQSLDSEPQRGLGLFLGPCLFSEGSEESEED